MVAFIYGPHARDMLAERGIDPLWVERTVMAPNDLEPDPKHPSRVRAFRVVRVLRVVYERTGHTVGIITVFLDRSRRRRG
jgi:hypothetical protein